jgi:hypothetical protein
MKTSHNPLARAEAATCRWMPVRPTDDQLEVAKPASKDGCRHHVTGPHLRALRKSTRSNIGVAGISQSTVHRRGRTEIVFYVNQGTSHRKIYAHRIGISEAFRRALELRSKWEELVEAANRAILASRAKQGRASA